MTASLTTVAYIGATILFILSLGGLSNPETSRRGNLYGIIGMTIAVLATVLGPRVAAAVLAQLCTLAFFVLLAWLGYSILEILETDRLVSLPDVPVAYANSVIPISAVLIVVGQLLVFPEVLREARGGARRAEELA